MLHYTIVKGRFRKTNSSNPINYRQLVLPQATWGEASNVICCGLRCPGRIIWQRATIVVAAILITVGPPSSRKRPSLSASFRPMTRSANIRLNARSLQVGRSGDRIPVGARFPAPVQTSLLHKWVSGLSWGVMRPGRDADHPPPSSAEVKERVPLYLYSPSWLL